MKISPIINYINKTPLKTSFLGGMYPAKRNTAQVDFFVKRPKDVSPEQKYKYAQPFIIEQYENPIVKTSTGEKVNCTYFTFPSGSENTDYARAAYAEGKIVGLCEMRLSTYPGTNEKKPWGESLDMDSEQIVYLATAPGYCGAGRDLVKGAIMDSYGSEKKGRVLLKVWQEALPKKFAQISGDKINHSAVPFYFNIGFRFINSKDDELSKKAMENYRRTGVYSKAAPNMGFMYLKESDALRFLES